MFTNFTLDSLNFIGFSAGAAALLGIWLGHIAVRKIEYHTKNIKLPMLLFLTVGLLFELVSLAVQAKWLSAIFGLLGITLLWDAVEIKRQENRVIKGHAPANPHNPRHQTILEKYPTATMVDVIKETPLED